MRIRNVATAAVMSMLVVVGLAGCTHSRQTGAGTPPSASVTPSGSPTNRPAPRAAPRPTGTHDCRALLGRGFTYDQMFDYWIRLGSPQDMDDDHDGWPCETVYGQRNAPTPPTGTHDCTALFHQGLTYEQMFDYWISLGSPQDMDDDHDGWPCETVYGDQN